MLFGEDEIPLMITSFKFSPDVWGMVLRKAYLSNVSPILMCDMQKKIINEICLSSKLFYSFLQGVFKGRLYSLIGQMMWEKAKTNGTWNHRIYNYSEGEYQHISINECKLPGPLMPPLNPRILPSMYVRS